MMSYLTKTLNKAYKASKKVIKRGRQQTTSETLTLLSSLIKKKQEVLPTSKMNKLASLSYQIQSYEEIRDFILDQLDKFSFKDSSEIKKYRNVFIIVGYLVKHGASGFIDDFREHIGRFKNYHNYEYQAHLQEDSDRRRRHSNLIDQVKNRAGHIILLLEDKQKLLRQKELAMKIKEKMKLYGQENISQENNSKQSNQSMRDKIDNFVQNYVWRYISTIDSKIDLVAQKIAEQIEKYLMEQIPESFQIDSSEEEQRVKTQFDFSEKVIKNEVVFVEEKNKQIKNPVLTKDLLDL